MAEDLDRRGIRSKPRRLSDGRTIGGGRFGVGALAYLLKNRFYIGEVVYRGHVHRGEHDPILDRALFQAVQGKLAAQALVETKRAYDKLVQLLDQEIRKRSGSANDLERFRETLDVASYLLGWAQFEYLVHREASDVIDEKARAHTVERHAWQYLKENLRSVTVRRRLDLVFDANPAVRKRLDKDYTVRSDVAHDYKYLPKEARDVSTWLQELEDLVAKF